MALNYKLDLFAGTFKGSDSGGVGFATAIIHDPYVLATGTTDTALPMGSVATASIVYLKSDQDLTLNINSNTGTNITLSANKPFFSSGLAVTALYLSNASGTSANITALIGGAIT